MTLLRIPSGALEWLRSGERGHSSESIFEHLTGIPLNGGRLSPPYDPSDLRRCRQLLAAVPEFAERMDEMRAASKVWAAIVSHWVELNTLYDEEVPTGTCPKTYALMRRLTERS